MPKISQVTKQPYAATRSTMAQGQGTSHDQLSQNPALHPPRIRLTGRSIIIEPLSAAHAEDLFSCVGGLENASLWTYMPAGPFESKASLETYINSIISSEDSVFSALIDPASQRAVGYLGLLRIDLKNRIVEIGSIMLSPTLQRSTAATEAYYLIAKMVFEDLGFRRYEWKCNNLNTPSKNAAIRLGFTFEGIFRQHMIVKGLNRDSAWFSVIDSEWPSIKNAFEKWLDPTNFDADGNQRRSLASFR
ncbi:acetyltransferase [Coccidioides immitis H538.4]|nr:acetyltransferase [Coccidioides immitis RMSCC 2394]KMU81162.1 acetyltransferase [Coccidioides immitis RMSCC 3703]KMU89464.1 acetyltransferase [Coccidioides immitis H538.4]